MLKLNKLFLLLIAGLGIFCPLKMQAQQNIKPLEIGDTLPDVALSQIVNFEKTSGNTADYKDKLLIIDFWTTTCTPCIASFAKLEELQQKFSGQVQILQSTYEDATRVNALYERLKKLNKKTRPSIVNDRILRLYFPHNIVPHVVWIKNNKVINITSGEELTENNISNILKEGSEKLPQKKDYKRLFSADINHDQTAFNLNVSELNVDGQTVKPVSFDPKAVVIQAIVTRFTDGFGKIARSNATTIQATNLTIKQLYGIALWKYGVELMNDNKTIVEIGDTALQNKITPPKGPDGRQRKDVDDIWRRNNKYCVEIKVPEEIADYKFDIMVSALNNYLGNLYGIEGVMEKRKMKTLALIRINREEKFKTKGDKADVKYDSSTFVDIKNAPIETLLMALRLPLQLKPFLVDETNYKGNIDLNFTCNLSDVSALNKELEKVGLKLVEKEGVDDIAVIRKIKK